MNETIKAEENEWFPLIFERRHRYKIFFGGRGGGKTWGKASGIIQLMHRNQWPTGQPIRACVLREIALDNQESTIAIVKRKIDDLGLGGSFRNSTQNKFRHENKSELFFRGLSDVTAKSIKGLESVDILWVEEAQQLGRLGFELLLPTIRRKHSEIWFSLNPELRTDPVYEMIEFYQKFPDPNVLLVHVNFDRNRFFTDENEFDRRRDEKHNPARYAHIWLGQPDDGDTKKKFLSYSDLIRCVRECDPEGRTWAGFDLADEGSDMCAIVVRKGNCVIHHEQWSGIGSTVQKSVARAVRICVSWGVELLIYDLTGIGGMVRGELEHVNFEHFGLNFQEAPRTPKKVWGFSGEKAIRQRDRYNGAVAQCADTLRSRLQISIACIENGIKDDPRALWFQSGMETLPKLLSQLAQPEEIETERGKMKVDKQPKPLGSTSRPPSPDGWDATLLAFSTDSTFGVVRENWELPKG